MTAFIASLIRTVVPVIVGALITWLATLGLNIETEGVDGLTTFLTILFTGVYYLVVRLIEQKFPQAGILLGFAKAPVVYSKATPVQQTPNVATLTTEDGSTAIQHPADAKDPMIG